MRNFKISYLLIMLLAISCNTTEDIEFNYDNEITEQEESNTDQSTPVIDENQKEISTNLEILVLDKQYRKDSSFILPTFNGNCPHKLDEIIKLFDYWKSEFGLNISYDVIGEPTFGTGSSLQLENCINKIIGSNLGQNIVLTGNEHIEIIVGRKFDKDNVSVENVDAKVIKYINLQTYGPISYAIHPTDKNKDLIADINGNIFLASNKEKLYSVENVTVKDNGGFLSLKYLDNDNYLIGFYTFQQSIYIDLFQFSDKKVTKIKTLKEYKFPKYYKCNKSTLLLEIYRHCESEGVESTYIGHAGGGIQVHDGEIYIGLGDTNIASSVFNSMYTTRDNNLPWGTILKFEFNYNLLKLVGTGNHSESYLEEVWIKGLRNPYRFSINKNSIWIADLGTSVEDEINLVPLNENNVDLGWPYFEGEFAHQPFYNISVNSIKQKSPIFSERIGGLIGGHFLKISGKNLYVFGTLDGRLFGLEIVSSGILKYQINIENLDFEDGNFLLSIEKSRNGIYLLTSNGTVARIDNS